MPRSYVLLDPSSNEPFDAASSNLIECGMVGNLHDHLNDALAALVKREGGNTAVARAAGCSPQTIYQIVKRVKLPSGKQKSVGRDLERRLDRAFPGWSDLTLLGAEDASSRPHGGAYVRGDIAPLAHQLSLAEPSLGTPPELRWESLLLSPLPPRFRLTLTDDAMALDDPPSMRRGDWAEFMPAASAEPNQVVLLADAHGVTYVRRYVLKRPGHWLAVARHGGFQPLDSVADGLRVIAIQVASGWG